MFDPTAGDGGATAPPDPPVDAPSERGQSPAQSARESDRFRRSSTESLLPIRHSVDHTPRASTHVDLTDPESSEVLSRLTSGTARATLQYLLRGPAVASDIAAAVDTSTQNAYYHAERLREVHLVEAVGTWYSSKGKAMTVYAPTAERLVVRFDP